MKLLLDTDIGSDIDDAICLAYLLAQPQWELLGITTVSGEPEKRAMLMNSRSRIDSAIDRVVRAPHAQPNVIRMTATMANEV